MYDKINVKKHVAAIIWGPIMVGTNERAQIGDDFAAGFQETKLGIDLVEVNLSYILENDDFEYVNEITQSSVVTNNMPNIDVNSYLESNQSTNQFKKGEVNRVPQLRRSVSAPRQQEIIRSDVIRGVTFNFGHIEKYDSDCDKIDECEEDSQVEEVVLRKKKKEKKNKM